MLQSCNFAFIFLVFSLSQQTIQEGNASCRRFRTPHAIVTSSWFLCHLGRKVYIDTIFKAIIWTSTVTAVAFVILRTLIHFYVHRRLSIDLLLIFFAISTLISCAGLYTKVTPTMFELDALTSFPTQPAELERDNLYLRCQFALIVLFWTTVWAVKFSILMFYKDLFNRMPKQKRLWWVVFGFVAASYLGCWATQLASCWPVHDYFHLGD